MKSDLIVIINKIRKLLALSTSPNVAEAASALNKANSLLLEYNLSMEQIKDFDNDPVDLNQFSIPGASKKWRITLINKLAEVNLCKAFLRGRSGFSIIGREVNVISVMVMWDYLEGAVKRIFKNNCPRQSKTPYRESFKLGIASGISQKLHDQFYDFTNTNTSNSLIVSLYHNEELKINNFIESIGLETGVIKIKNDNRTAYYKGFSHGLQVNLNKQLTS